MFGLVNEEDWVAWFARTIREFGGKYNVWRDLSGGAAKITGRRLFKRTAKPVREMRQGQAKQALEVAQTMMDVAADKKDAAGMEAAAAQMAKLKNVYYRDRHGSLRRVLAK